MSENEHYLKRMFYAGFNAGVAAAHEGSTDLPLHVHYESFVEQHGLPPTQDAEIDQHREAFGFYARLRALVEFEPDLEVTVDGKEEKHET